jgi:tetratricopeptide (TPR) repeat protein
VVHRDIKPDNVLLSGGSATVADFGIAKAIAAARAEGDTGATLTQIGSSLGTPAYMAPEQAAADPSTNHRADIYAFGCMAYEMLAGRPPFIAKSPQRLLAAQMSDTPEPILALRPDTPPALSELVMDCLAKDADARPQQAAEIVRVLDTVTSAGGHAAMPRVLLGGEGMLGKALAAWAVTFLFVAILAKASIVAIGLPSWVFPGAIAVMALGLPVILFTAYSHRVTKLEVTQTPTYTPGGSQRRSSGTVATLAIKASPHLSWRRTWIGGAVAVTAFVVLIALYMVSRATGIGPFGSLMAAGALGQNERLLVADFGGSSDSLMGPVITEAFRTALSQSRSVSVIQPNEIRDVLQRMRRPTNTRVDFAVAREIASREGVKAVVDGSILNVGGNYALSVRLVSPQTGVQLASFRETATGEKELLPAIDKLARDLRERIGESLKQVQSTIPLERVTTPSLEALKKYVQGSRLMSYEGDFPRGAAMLEEAIALDTGFAMAYRRLAVEYSNRNQPDRAMTLLEKAYQHSDRLSDAERYLVLGSYYQRGPRQDIAKSTAAYEALIDLQPDHITPLNNVAINYRWQRDWVKAEGVLRRAMAVGNPPAVTYNQLIWTLWNQGKKDEAWRVLAQFDSVFPNNMNRGGRRWELYIGERQFDSAMTLARTGLQRATDPTSRAPLLGALGSTSRIQGRLRDAMRYGEEHAASNRQRGMAQVDLEHAARMAADRAQFFNDSAGAVRLLDRALAATPIERLPESVRPYLDLAAVYAYAGRPDRSREMLASFERSRSKIVSNDDPVNAAMLRGFVAVGEKRYAEAARQFQEADKGDCPVCVLPDLANAWDMAGNADSAIAVYERYIAQPDAFRWQLDQWFLAGTHKRLGELYEARGERQKALSNYLQFVEIWKNADPELQPRVAEVRARITRLKDTEGR